MDCPFINVAAVEQVLVNGTSHWPIKDPLGLGIVPQQIALMSDNTFISASLRFSIPGDVGLLTSRVRLAPLI
jgi:hypothetical protein